jgi:hypothetical protein
VNRFSPIRCGTETSSTLLAFPQGVVTFAMTDNVALRV